MNPNPVFASRSSNKSQHLKRQRPRDNHRLLFVLSSLSLIALSAGYSIAYIVALGGGTLKALYGDTAVIPVVRAFFVASFHFGIAFGIFFSKWVLHLTTRGNLTLILCIICVVLLGILQIPNLVVYFVFRTLHGIVIGVFIILMPRYIKEITPHQFMNKPAFGIFRKSSLLFGLVVALAFNIILLKNQVNQDYRWRIVLALNALPILIAIILMLLDQIPQSPNSLILQGKGEEAKNVLRLFYKEQFLEQVYAAKVREVKIVEKIEKSSSKKISKLKTFLAFQVPILNQLSGVNAYISQMGFVTSAYSPIFSSWISLILATVYLLGLISSIFYIHRFTPRSILLTGSFWISMCCFVIGIGFILIKSYSNAFWIIIAFSIALVAINGATFVAAQSRYIAEIGTREVILWSLMVNWFVAACSYVLFITLTSYVGVAPVFIASGVITLIGFIFKLIFMIQTNPHLKKKGPNIELRPFRKYHL